MRHEISQNHCYGNKAIRRKSPAVHLDEGCTAAVPGTVRLVL